MRQVGFLPEITVFKPLGVPRTELEEVVLSVEEIEAIRLKDLEGMDQNLSAEQMKVSRATFQRVLNSARTKIADVLINGKLLRIEGGDFELDEHCRNRQRQRRRCDSDVK